MHVNFKINQENYIGSILALEKQDPNIKTIDKYC